VQDEGSIELILLPASICTKYRENSTRTTSSMTKNFIVIFQKPLIMALVFGLFWLLPAVISPLGLPVGYSMAQAQEGQIDRSRQWLPRTALCDIEI
jgi:hypothetical protein